MPGPMLLTRLGRNNVIITAKAYVLFHLHAGCQSKVISDLRLLHLFSTGHAHNCRGYPTGTLPDVCELFSHTQGCVLRAWMWMRKDKMRTSFFRHGAQTEYFLNEESVLNLNYYN